MDVDNVACWNGKSTHYARPGGWSALGSGVAGYIHAAQVIGNDLYVGGSFGQAGGKASSGIARWTIPQAENAVRSWDSDRASVRLACATPASPTSPSRLMLGPAATIDLPARVYDVAGRCVRTIIAGAAGADRSATSWDGLADEGAPLAPGVYFVRAGEGSGAASYRVVVLD